ncbi:MAG: hypothetical protein CL961_07105 [Euryarchaeota archaeon]|mgnify:FL=1|nr:hypothetical protein [Euryarchaeota archaeon]|tara:strand:+ start:409 stop:1689 length:1281 start_codon:yes stop_codon:yes gene_type:complete
MSYTTSWTVTTYDSADNIQPGHWYSVRNKKLDGMSLGTVMSIFRDKNGNWGDLDGNLDSRFPGWIECDGRTLNVADYPDLWDNIKNTYGGNGAKTVNGNTKTYSGTFNLPNYRNRRLHGTGNVDGNSAASPILTTVNAPDPASSGSGDGFTAGSMGGNWYIKKIDAQGDPPDEQVYSGTGQSDSKFFKLGTLVTSGSDNITGNITYDITGNTFADIGPVASNIVSVPAHEHSVISGQADQVPVGWVPWGSPPTGGAFYGIGTGEIRDTTYSQIGYNSVVSPGGEFNATFNNYWPGDAQNTVPGLPGGNRYTAGVLCNNVDANVKVYSPGTLASHSHFIQEGSDFGDASNVYGWGNDNGPGTGAGSIAENDTTTINFSSTELALTANEATFELNVSKVVIPTPSLVPEQTIPLLTKYHRVKYIIKAY